MKVLQNKGERILAFIILVFSANLLASSFRYKFFINDTTPGAGLFPGIISGVLVFLSLLWVITTFTPTKDEEIVEKHLLDSEPNELFEEMHIIDRDGQKRIGCVLAWSLALFLTFERIGVLLGISLYITGLLYSVAKVKVWKALPTSLLFTILFSWGAIKIGVQLPDPFNLYRILGLTQ